MKRDRQQKFKDSAYRLVNQTQCHWVGNHPDDGFQIKCIEPPVRDGWCRIHKTDAKPSKSDEPSVGFEDGTSQIPKLPVKGKKAGTPKAKKSAKGIDNMLDEIQDEDNIDTDNGKKAVKKATQQAKSKKLQEEDLDDVMDEESTSSKKSKKSKKVQEDDVSEEVIPKTKSTKTSKTKEAKGSYDTDEIEDDFMPPVKAKKSAKTKGATEPKEVKSVKGKKAK